MLLERGALAADQPLVLGLVIRHVRSAGEARVGLGGADYVEDTPLRGVGMGAVGDHGEASKPHRVLYQSMDEALLAPREARHSQMLI